MPNYAAYVKFIAKPGQRDALVELLLQAAKSVEAIPACHVYIINTSPSEADAVWVTEIWNSQADAEGVLTTAEAKANIQRVIALLARMPERTIIQPVGGKGMPLG